MFIQTLKAERLKLRHTHVWIFLLISPFISFFNGFLMKNGVLQSAPSGEEWRMFLSITLIQYGILFYPLLVGILAALLCRYEHRGNNLKQLFSLPNGRINLYFAKLFWLLLLLGLNQVLTVLAVVASGFISHLPPGLQVLDVIKIMGLGYIAVFPLAILQLGLAFIWKNFAASFSVSIMFTLPTILIANSEKFGPFYPWAQPLLAMNASMFHVSFQRLYLVIFISMTIALFLSLLYVKKKPV